MRDTPKDEKKDQNNNYSFLKETVRKPPLTIRQRGLLVAHMVLLGAVLGGGFSIGHYGITKLTREIERKKEMEHPKVSLTENEAGASDIRTEELEFEVGPMRSMSYFEQVYEEAQKLAQKPIRSLVHVFSYSSEEDLLDHSLHPMEDSIGMVFLNSADNYYIFTMTDNLYGDKKAVMFADGSVVEAIPCGYDPGSGFWVVRVPEARMRDETRAYISVTELSEKEIEGTASVIAVGNLQGHEDSLLYGVVTSDDLIEYGTDCSMELFATNIFSSANGSGIILDRFGACVGWICLTEENDKSISAFKSTSIRELAEILANGDKVRYLGIKGSDITENQAQSLRIPMGIYVDSFEIDSPAADYGIQIGDIISAVGEEETLTVEAYAKVLQSLPVGEPVKLTIYRKNGIGIYKEMMLELEVAGR